ncbi:MAG: hypothetical protein R6X02_07920 [Enhygromyxa sp.]
MPSLSDQLLRPEAKPHVIDGCCKLVEREVASKRGFSGAAVKAGFAVVTKVKPGFIRDVVSVLLPEFTASLDPLYEQCASEAETTATGSSAAELFARRVTSERSRAAEALLGVTDRRIGGARPAVQRAYEKLRPNARENVEAALPGLVETLRPWL